MARISILTLPEPGHFLPTLKLAAGLQARGHQASYITTPSFRDFFLSQGFGCTCVLSRYIPSMSAGDIFSTGSSLALALGHLAKHGRATWVSANSQAAGLWAGMLDLAAPEILSVEADLVLCDAAVVGTPEARHLIPAFGRPVVCLNPQMEPTGVPIPEVILCPRQLEIGPYPPLPDHLWYCEPSIHRSRPQPEFPWHRLRSDRKLVYCSFGSQWLGYDTAPAALHAVLLAFARMPGYQLVVGAPGLRRIGLVASRLRHLLERPAENVIVVEAAPQLELLARADLMITHGGLGSVKEAITAGVPMLVVPFRWDQPENGRRVEHHGLGRVCAARDCTEGRIEALVTEMIDDQALRERIEAMSALFRQQEQEAPAVRIVSGLVHVLGRDA
jgi:UDP:flavonoid glycosyltransferase YjiC (YdhE family)